MSDVALTTTEADTLAELEGVIAEGLKTFVDVGSALLRIRDERLYRTESATFEGYCRERWGFSDGRARQLIGAAQTVTTVTVEGLPAPTNEGQARELARVPEEDRAEVWQQTLEATDGRPTASAIRETYKPTPPPTEPEPSPDFPPPSQALPIEDPLPGPIAEQIDQRIAERTQPTAEEWNEEETALREQLEHGRTVVVTMRGPHDRLITWAEARGLFVRVDRRSQWGNPFELGADGDRSTVIGNYRDHYLPHKPSLLDHVHQLRGKALGCWCAPEPCHGDVIADHAQGGQP